MIRAANLTKLYGTHRAVDNISFEIQSGKVTGFLGPNGAGKSTTLRMIMGLDRPTSGIVTIGGEAYRDLRAPMRRIGALLDAKAVDGGRTARRHLEWLAIAGALPKSRVDASLELTGLLGVANKKIGGFSLGMHQRLGIAAALLGDPEILVLDEPVNGLDPEGIRWVRTLMRRFADEGRTVLVSSHLMSEMERTADHILVIGGGKLVADKPMNDFVASTSPQCVDVVSPDCARLESLVVANGGTVASGGRPDAVRITNMDNVRVAELAASAGIVLHEIIPQHESLEARFMELTYDSVDYRSKDEPK